MNKVIQKLWRYKEWITIFLFIIYCIFIIYYALLCRKAVDEHKLELRLMWAYREMLTGHPEWKEDVGYNLKNILFFVPFGFLFPNITTSSPAFQKKRLLIVLIIGMLFSILIEIMQYVFCLGLCELDDVICNSLGALIGFRLYSLIKNLVNYTGLINKGA